MWGICEDNRLKIGVGLSFYEDLESLKHTMPTYTSHVDYVFAIDGRYSFFEGNDFSSQETQDYVKSFPNVIYEQFVGMEHDKRQKYVDLASKYKCDALFIIDSDEGILEANWDLFYKSVEERIKQYPSENFFGVDFRYTPPDFKPAEFCPYPRIWARPQECSYYKAHCIFRGLQGLTRSSSQTPKIEGLKMFAGDNFRSDEYLRSISAYQQKMIDHEIPIRHALRDNKVF